MQLILCHRKQCPSQHVSKTITEAKSEGDQHVLSILSNRVDFLITEMKNTTTEYFLVYVIGVL